MLRAITLQCDVCKIQSMASWPRTLELQPWGGGLQRKSQNNNPVLKSQKGKKKKSNWKCIGANVKRAEKEEIKFPCQLFSKLEHNTVLLWLEGIIKKRTFVSSAGQVDSTAPGGIPGQGMFMLMSHHVSHPSNHTLTVLQNKEFYLVFAYKNGDFLASGLSGTERPNTTQVPLYLWFLKSHFCKICIFIQHNRKFINNIVNKLHMNLREKKGGKLESKKCFRVFLLDNMVAKDWKDNCIFLRFSFSGQKELNQKCNQYELDYFKVFA